MGSMGNMGNMGNVGVTTWVAYGGLRPVRLRSGLMRALSRPVLAASVFGRHWQKRDRAVWCIRN